jgi:5-methylcytosine-specific restriction endonuclease McrA
MKLSEYLRLKCRVPALTRPEAKTIGVPYPLVKGWAIKYAELEVPDLLAGAAHLSKNERKKIAGQVRSLKNQQPKKQKPIKQPKVKKLKVKSAVEHPDYAWVNSDDFLKSFEWRKLRMMALKRDGARCVCCGATAAGGSQIHVDHIKPRRSHPELALALSNLQILCEDCNHGKGSWDDTDWRFKTIENISQYH